VTPQIPVCVLYNSALFEELLKLLLVDPPATRTCPFGSSVAVCKDLGDVSEFVLLQPVCGSYNSVLLVALKESTAPPATRTLPLGNNVAVWEYLAVVIDSVMLQVLVCASYTSALLSALLDVALLFRPPATRTLLFGSSVAV
jgi:hypothetical protein